MRLGLVGRGPQAQRYLLPKNGGAHIVSQVPGRIGMAEYQDWLQGVDGVIIATHPAGHRHLALDAIAAGKHVLIEKPLALNLEDCEEILDAAEAALVHVDVAHTHIWSPTFWEHRLRRPSYAYVEYVEHSRDYSAWLDWAPHLIAMLAHANPTWGSAELEAACSVRLGERRRVRFIQQWDDQRAWAYLGCENEHHAGRSAMAEMLKAFVAKRYALCAMGHSSYYFNRRVYRALFAQENNATR